MIAQPPQDLQSHIANVGRALEDMPFAPVGQ